MRTSRTRTLRFAIHREHHSAMLIRWNLDAYWYCCCSFFPCLSLGLLFWVWNFLNWFDYFFGFYDLLEFWNESNDFYCKSKESEEFHCYFEKKISFEFCFYYIISSWILNAVLIGKLEIDLLIIIFNCCAFSYLI